MRITRLLLPVSIALMAAVAFPSCAHPQRVEPIAAANNTPSAAPLQILDDFGQPITESQIRRKMKPSRARWAAYPLGFLVGAFVVGAGAPRGPSKDNCSVYEPCSDREKFYRSSSVIAGGMIGLILGGAAAAGGTDRFEAIDKIRLERRGARR